MTRLPGISQKEAVRVFQKLGYRIVRESGHLILSNGERRLVIPGNLQERAAAGTAQSPGNGLLLQLAIADRPSRPGVALPLGRHYQRRPAQLMGGAAHGGIGAAGTAVDNQMHQPAARAAEQLSGNPLLGPGQIMAASGGDHHRASRNRLPPR